MTPFFVVSILFIIVCSVVSQDSKPTMVVEVFRHGARTLIHSAVDYFKFNEPESLLPSGQRQQYNLGKLMAKKYPHLLESTDPKYIYARSSEPVRCTMSLQAQMFGAFEGKIPSLPEAIPAEAGLPVFDDAELINEIASKASDSAEAIPHGFIPFTYDTKSIYNEDMLHVAPWNCRYVQQQQEVRTNSDADQEMLVFFEETISKIKSMGFKVDDLFSVAKFGESLHTMHLQGRDAELPEELKYGGLIFNDTKFINVWTSTYYFVGEELERAIKIRNMLSQIIDWFQGIANGTNTLKFSFLSGHETSYLALLSSYGIYNDKCLVENYKAQRSGKEIPHPDCIFPEYASQVIYEIYNETGNPYVKFLYNGKPFKVCKESEGYECKLDDFIAETRNMLKNLTKQDVMDYCAMQPKITKMSLPGTSSMLYIGLELLAFLGPMITLFIYKTMVAKKRKVIVEDAKAKEVSTDPIESV